MESMGIKDEELWVNCPKVEHRKIAVALYDSLNIVLVEKSNQKNSFGVVMVFFTASILTSLSKKSTVVISGHALSGTLSSSILISPILNLLWQVRDLQSVNHVHRGCVLCVLTVILLN